MKKSYIGLFLILPIIVLAQALNGTVNNTPAIVAISDSSSSNTNIVANVATNTAAFGIVQTNFISGRFYTNYAQRASVGQSWNLTTSPGNTAGARLDIDQDANGSFELNIPISLSVSGTNIATSSGELSCKLNPNAVFTFTNTSVGTASTPVSGSGFWIQE